MFHQIKHIAEYSYKQYCQKMQWIIMKAEILQPSGHLVPKFSGTDTVHSVGRFRILGGQGLEYWGGGARFRILGGPRFRILGGPRFRILGGQGGPNSQQAHDVVMTSMRRNNVASTSFRRHVPTRFLINQCQIITFLIKLIL